MVQRGRKGWGAVAKQGRTPSEPAAAPQRLKDAVLDEPKQLQRARAQQDGAAAHRPRARDQAHPPLLLGAHVAAGGGDRVARPPVLVVVAVGVELTVWLDHVWLDHVWLDHVWLVRL